MVSRLGFRITTSTPASKESSLASLSSHLLECMRLRREGALHARLAYEQGYADGAIRSLLDSGIVTDNEVLEFIAELRRKFDGPAARSVSPSVSEEALGVAEPAE